jgi:hypothetical protein
MIGKSAAHQTRIGFRKMISEKPDHFRRIVAQRLFLLNLAIFICVLKKRDLWFGMGAVDCSTYPAFGMACRWSIPDQYTFRGMSRGRQRTPESSRAGTT